MIEPLRRYRIRAAVGRPTPAGVSWIALALAATLVVGCQAIAVPQPVQEPGPRTALEGCHLPGSLEKGGGTLTFDWQTSVEMIVPDGEVLFFTSDLDNATCEVWRGPDGTWGNSVVGIGRLDPADPSALTYDTGMNAAPANPRIIAVGRAPVGSTRVEATAAGDDVFTVLGAGFYVIRVDGAGPLTEIVAWNDAGVQLGRLFDPAGLQPFVTSRPTAPS